MGASYIGGCIFRFGEACSVLNTKKCKGCKFRKTAAEWDEGQQKAKEILRSKGIMVCEGTDLNGDKIITTKPNPMKLEGEIETIKRWQRERSVLQSYKSDLPEDGVKVYICDHEKNTQCKKTSCWYLDRGECFHTLNKEFEKED